MKPYKWCRYCDKIKSECKCARPSIVLCENDHLEAVKQARADALRLVFERIEKINSESGRAIQASEIEKRAAMALVELFKNTIEECVMTRRLESLRGRCTEYIEAYDYAKSIGAIE